LPASMAHINPDALAPMMRTSVVMDSADMLQSFRRGYWYEWYLLKNIATEAHGNISAKAVFSSVFFRVLPWQIIRLYRWNRFSKYLALLTSANAVFPP
ncbi:MAG: hypothetical protein WBN81_07915, partial [Gammaproteobacteria bacterium]